MADDALASPRQFLTTGKGEGFSNADGSCRQAEINRLRPGDPITLTREPQNRRDPKAVALISGRGIQIGYLNRDIARLVAPVLDGQQTMVASVERVQCRTRPGSPRIAVLRVTWPVETPPDPQNDAGSCASDGHVDDG